MEKSETIHIRVSPEVKKESEKVLKKLVLTTSYAVLIFLKQVIYQNKIPFDVALPNDEDIKKKEQLAKIINQTGGGSVDKSLEPIIHLYANGSIDYDTACLTISRRFTNI